MKNNNNQYLNFKELKKYFVFLFVALSVSILSRISLNYRELFSGLASVIVLDAIFLLLVFLFDEIILHNVANFLKRYFLLYLFSGLFGLLLFDLVINKNLGLSAVAYIFLFVFRASIVFLAKVSIDSFFKVEEKEIFFIKALSLYVFVIFLSFISSFSLDVQFSWSAGIILFYLILNIIFLRFLLKQNKKTLGKEDKRPVIFY